MKNQIEAIKQHGLNNLENINEGQEASDLHHELYNMDYFIIGTYQAQQSLQEFGIFKAIEIVKDYENDNFGELTTDISNPEKLVNMLAYIIGEQLLGECKTLQDAWNEKLTTDQIEEIKKELTEAEVNI